MRTVFDQKDCQNLKVAVGKEWLETNGRGGFASSTIIGANVRRHHGWLVAALEPAGRRFVLLSKVEDRVIVNGEESHLSTNLYPGTVFPHGFNIQMEFRLRPWPTFRYAGRDFAVERSVCLIHGQDTIVISYRNTGTRGTIELKVRPLLAFREADALTKRNDAVSFDVNQTPGRIAVQPYAKLPKLYFHCGPATVETKGDWYHRFTYPVDEERGLEFEEDLHTPFEVGFKLRPGETAHLVATLDANHRGDAEALLAAERQRRKPFDKEPDETRRALLIASEAFLTGSKVLAGYPWLAERNRDTMIALPGLTLTTGKVAIARQVLLNHRPFTMPGEDTELWFVVAAWRYWKATGDNAGLKQLLPVLTEVIKHYRPDKDGLVSVGVQQTWMDVKAEGYVPTPRPGKPVEVNALWFNALLMVAELEENVAGDIRAAVILRKLAETARGNFAKVFWNAAGGYLFDVVDGNTRDPSIRPNQIFAVSLPHSPLDPAQQKSVFDVVTQHLLTPAGLRSLARGHERYCGRYAGNAFQRDCATHQGTVWPWLIGAYCDAYAKVNGPGKALKKELAGLAAHLEEAGLGFVSEMFEGDAPHRPVGGFAQAWSVAEVLRVYDAYGR